MIDLCGVCRRRPASSVVIHHGVIVKRGAIADHDMCSQCWRSQQASLARKRPRGRLDGVLDDLLAGREPLVAAS